MAHSDAFCIEGRFAGFEAGGKSPFKYLRLESESDEWHIKLSKQLQLMLFRYLAVGDRLRVVGQQKTDKHTGKPRYKAQDVVRIDHGTVPEATVAAKSAPDAQRKKKKTTRILVCNKSSCRKRGSEAVCRAISQNLSQFEQGDIELKTTGCMDRCKAGPNIVMMPDKAKYTRVSPNQIPKLMQQHYRDASVTVQS